MGGHIGGIPFPERTYLASLRHGSGMETRQRHNTGHMGYQRIYTHERQRSLAGRHRPILPQPLDPRRSILASGLDYTEIHAPGSPAPRGVAPLNPALLSPLPTMTVMRFRSRTTVIAIIISTVFKTSIYVINKA